MIWYNKVGNHWFIIYLDNHKKKLSIKILFYNICLFITKNRNINFDITELQANHTFNVRTKILINKKEVKIIEAKFKVKSQIMLEAGISRNFNNCDMMIKDKIIIIIQIKQILNDEKIIRS